MKSKIWISRFMWILAMVVVLNLLTGCAYQKKYIASRNRGKLEGIQLKMTTEEVIEQMGDPWKKDAYLKDDHTISVFYYITEHITDGATTLSEATPLILQDGILVGWGQSALLKFR